MKRIKMKNAGGWGKLCLVLFMGFIGLQQAMAAAEVWVSDERGNDATGAGTFESPYKTIQKGVDEVDANGTVKILRGVYGAGEEHFAGSHTNRVVISGKSVTLDGVEGKDVTHLVGYLDPTTDYGHGPTAIRCIYIADEVAKNSVIKNLTLRDSGADSANTNSGIPYGYGGAVSYFQDARSSVWLVDCVISNCVACMGGAIEGANAARCLITRCTSTGFGSATRNCSMIHCLITKNRCVASSSARPALSLTTAVNCTIALGPGVKSQGLGRATYAYNCVTFGNGGADIVGIGTTTYTVAVTNNCYETATDAHLLFSPVSGDFRLTAGTEADGGGLTDFLTSKITLPAFVDPAIDYAGNRMDLTKETCDPGCFQGAATPAGGRINFRSTGWIVNGCVNDASDAYNYYTPDAWPTSVVARPLVANVTNYVYSVTSDGYFGHNKNRRYFPLMDGSHVITPPPNTTDTLRLTPTMANLVVYASPDADPAQADGSLEHPFATLQDAVVCVTNSSASIPLILALPGVYDKGGEEIAGVFTRLVLPSAKHFNIRSTEGPERTVIKGGVDESNTGYYAGCGPDAVRCIHISRGDNTVTPSAVQGFTITDGRTHCDEYKTDTPQYCGGGIYASGKNTLVSQVLDCIITNCAAVRSGASMGATLFRCRLYDCHAYGGVTRATGLLSCYVDSSCTLGSAPADASANSVIGTSSSTYFTTAPESTATEASSLYNSLFVSYYPGNVTLWGSVTTNAAAASSTKGCAYVRNPNFADPANNDWRLRTTTPVRTECKLPAKDASAYTTWAANVAYYFQGDIDGNPLSVTDGKPLPGCWQTTAGGRSVFADAENGGLSIPDGGNVEAASLPFAVEVGPAIRPCVGCVVNGVTNLFADTPSVAITAADLEASGYGIVIKAIYGNDLYVNPADGVGNDLDDGFNGFRPSSPMKTLAAVMALVLPGDTVHAAPGDYNEGVMYHAEAVETSPASRVVVPSDVTLVSDEGADVTFITGASATVADNDDNKFGCGTNAVRCAYLESGATLKGFTLRGGRTRSGEFNSYVGSRDYTGGGIYSPAAASAAAVSATRVEDCVVSNCVALTGGAGYGVTFNRCRLFRCRAVRGSAAERVRLVNTIADDMDSGGTSGIGVANWYGCVNSTIGKNFRRDSTGKADGYAMFNQWSRSYGLSNCVVRGTAAVTNAVNCVFRSTDSHVNITRGDMINCRKLTDEECALDEEYRPDCATSLLVDAGAPLDLGEKDVYGGQRVYNGKLDIGAVEADWRPMFAKLLDGTGRRLQIAAADSGVCTNDVGGVPAVVLHDGEELPFAWSMTPRSAPRRGNVRVTGAGTLTLTHNGETFASFTASDGVAEFTLPAAWLDAFAFAFEGEGSADLFGFAAPVGTALSFR